MKSAASNNESFLTKTWKENTISRIKNGVASLERRIEILKKHHLELADVRGDMDFTFYVNELRDNIKSAENNRMVILDFIIDFSSVSGDTEEEVNTLNDLMSRMENYINWAEIDCDRAFRNHDNAQYNAPARKYVQQWSPPSVSSYISGIVPEKHPKKDD